MDQSNPKPEPSLEDDLWALSESDEEEDNLKSDSSILKKEDESMNESKAELDDILLPTETKPIKEEPKDDKSDSDQKDGESSKKKDGKSRKELEEEDREKMQ